MPAEVPKWRSRESPRSQAVRLRAGVTQVLMHASRLDLSLVPDTSNKQGGCQQPLTRHRSYRASAYIIYIMRSGGWRVLCRLPARAGAGSSSGSVSAADKLPLAQLKLPHFAAETCPSLRESSDNPPLIGRNYVLLAPNSSGAHLVTGPPSSCLAVRRRSNAAISPSEFSHTTLSLR